MTRLEWSEMTQCERDAAVAEHVLVRAMSRRTDESEWRDMEGNYGELVPLPKFTEDSADGWAAMRLVVEAMLEDGLVMTTWTDVDDGTDVQFILWDNDNGIHETKGHCSCGEGGSFPADVCIAALRSKGVEVMT